ncbi:hypothetical protein VC83_09543 [Pseudogymnoascus destructans]|uniref:Uncharacterized protein n=1 Tax=Pseudogymnoascus destructans TaxID=655981 RepID=A0A176ZWR8_9PEZI|nr:uncharacterized protein VC83_09543 [Pseudogymnoascus destructans]OAF54217.1 hypothetical protein VC83_09543 [Pseudogymnoascus destructans]
MKQHGNKVHSKQRVADEDLFQPVQLQSWFDERRARYWVVDRSRQEEQVRQGRRAIVRDAGEDSDAGDGLDSGSDGGGHMVDDQIIQDIEKWKADKQERRLHFSREVPAVEMDSWLQYTRWNEALSQSKHNMVETSRFARMPDPEEPKLERLLRAWKRIMERCLDTLEDIDHKDVLKWWASPKNEAASQRPFELPQSTKSMDKYSRVWEGFICYMMRTATGDWGEDSETGVEYTYAQWRCIQRIRRGLDSHEDIGGRQ